MEYRSPITRCVKFSPKDVCINSLILLFRRVRESFFFVNDEWGIKTFVVHITKQMNSISQQNKIGSKHPLKKNKQGPCLVKTQDTSSQLLQTKPCTHKRENFFCQTAAHPFLNHKNSKYSPNKWRKIQLEYFLFWTKASVWKQRWYDRTSQVILLSFNIWGSRGP